MLLKLGFLFVFVWFSKHLLNNVSYKIILYLILGAGVKSNF